MYGFLSDNTTFCIFKDIFIMNKRN